MKRKLDIGSFQWDWIKGRTEREGKERNERIFNEKGEENRKLEAADLQCERVHQMPIRLLCCLRAAMKAKLCAFLIPSASGFVLRKGTMLKLHYQRRHLDSKYDCTPSEITFYGCPWHYLGTDNRVAAAARGHHGLWAHCLLFPLSGPRIKG